MGRGPGTVCALLSRYGRCEIFGPIAWRRPGRFTRAPGGTVSSAGGRGAEKLAVPTSPVPVRQQVPVSRPATGEASRNAPDPGVSPRAVPLDRPPPPLRCLGPEAPLLRRRQPEGCTPPGPVGKNGGRNGGGVERVGELGSGYRNTRLLPNEVGEVDRMRSSRDGGALEGVRAVKTPPPPSVVPLPIMMGRRRDGNGPRKTRRSGGSGGSFGQSGKR